jgi:hypothetical protein
LEPEREASSRARSSHALRGILYILVSAFSFWIGWSLSKMTPNENVGETVSPQDTPGDPQPSGEMRSVIVSQPPPSPEDQEGSKRSTDDTPLWKKIAEGAIAFGTVGLLIINIFLWRSTNDALRIAQQNNADSRAIQAAKLTIEMPPPTITERDGYMYAEGVIRATNVGGTAAIDPVVDAHFGSGTQFPTWPGRTEAIPKPDPTRQPISPNKPLELSYNILLGQKVALFNRTQYASWLIGVGYRDVFGGVYGFTSCYTFRPNNGTYYYSC